MNKSALKNNSTQKFTQVQDIIEDVVILQSGSACVVIEVLATNFELLSPEEQDARIIAYSNLLNSLSFEIQILIRSKRVDINNYLKTLDIEASKTQNKLLAQNIMLYKNFVSQLVKQNTILDKKFYIVIPYSSLEKGVMGAKESVGKSQIDVFFAGAKSSLYSKAENVLAQLQRTGLKAQRLNKDKLIKLYYDIFNDQPLQGNHDTDNMADFITKGGKK